MRCWSELGEQFLAQGKVEDCPVYDLHGHMGGFYGAYMDVLDAAGTVAAMDRAGLRMSVFSHHAALLAPDIGNAPAVEAVRQFPNRLRAYCAINPNYQGAVRRDMEAFDDHADVYVGFKLLPDYHTVCVDDARYADVLRMADDRELMVLIHTWGNSSYTGGEHIVAVAERYSHAKLLLGHSLHGRWDQAIDLAKRFDNIYLELCAVMDERGILEKLVQGFGSQRLVYGTDFPWFDHHYYIGAILGAEITDEDRRNIFYRNARRLLGEPN